MIKGSRKADAADVYVGGRIRMARLLLGIGQPVLAAGLGVSFQQLQKYERGQSRISISRLAQAARLLGVSLDFFSQDMRQTEGSGQATQGSGSAHELLAYLDAPGAVELMRQLAGMDDALRADIAAFVREASRLRPPLAQGSDSESRLGD